MPSFGSPSTVVSLGLLGFLFPFGGVFFLLPLLFYFVMALFGSFCGWFGCLVGFVWLLGFDCLVGFVFFFEVGCIFRFTREKTCLQQPK